jgi:hypothetical protein
MNRTNHYYYLCICAILIIFSINISIQLPLLTYAQQSGQPNQGAQAIQQQQPGINNPTNNAPPNPPTLPRESNNVILNMSNNSGVSLLPRVAAVPGSNNVYAVWTDNTAGNYEIFFKRSTDGGATFGNTINLSNNSGVSLLPRVAAVPGSNNVYIMWVDNTAGKYNVFFKRSTDGGATFGNTINLSNNNNVGLSFFPQMATSSSFKVYVVWADNSTGRYNVFFKRSTDGGATFGNTINLSNNNNVGLSFFPQISAQDSNNNVYITWVDNTAGNYEIFFKRSTDGGATFGNTINLSNNSGVSLLPRVAAVPGSNNVYAVWADNSTGRYNVFFKRSTDGGATFGNVVNLSNTDGMSSTFRTNVTAYNPQLETSGNNVYVVWEEHNTNFFSKRADIFFKRSTDYGASFTGQFGIDLSKNPGTSINPFMAVSGNNIYIVWQDNTTNLAKPNLSYDIFFKQGINNGERLDPTINLSHSPGTSINPFMAVSGNNIYIVWQNNTPQGREEIFFTKIKSMPRIP